MICTIKHNFDKDLPLLCIAPSDTWGRCWCWDWSSGKPKKGLSFSLFLYLHSISLIYLGYLILGGGFCFFCVIEVFPWVFIILGKNLRWRYLHFWCWVIWQIAQIAFVRRKFFLLNFCFISSQNIILHCWLAACFKKFCSKNPRFF